VTSALCALVLAAGEGTRLRPLTETLPKPLTPVGNVTLVDRALARLARHGLSGPAMVAVNVCYLAEQVSRHVGSRAFVSREPGPPALGTSGALGNLHDWVSARAVLVANSDAYLAPRHDGPDLGRLLDGWDGSTVRVLTVPAGDRAAEFGAGRFAGVSLIPAKIAATLPPTRTELVHTVWRPAERDGRLEVIEYDGLYLDTGTPADYLAANLHAASGGVIIAPDATVAGTATQAVIGAGACVAGSVIRCVVLPGAQVGPDEHLVDSIRAGRDVTITAAPG
jgi:MurNAc alpha-1-phosphate uridylyltransferase